MNYDQKTLEPKEMPSWQITLWVLLAIAAGTGLLAWWDPLKFFI